MSDIYLQLILCPCSNAKHDHNALFSVLSKICCVYLSHITMQNHSSHRLFPQFCVCVCVCGSCSVESDSFQLHVLALQAPQTMDYSKQEYWSGLAFPTSGDLPDPGIEPRSPALHRDSLLSEPPEKP